MTPDLSPTTPKRKRCPICHGRGYLVCDCWPGDCICGFGDEECEECGGTGDADWNDYHMDHDDAS